MFVSFIKRDYVGRQAFRRQSSGPGQTRRIEARPAHDPTDNSSLVSILTVGKLNCRSVPMARLRSGWIPHTVQPIHGRVLPWSILYRPSRLAWREVRRGTNPCISLHFHLRKSRKVSLISVFCTLYSQLSPSTVRARILARSTAPCFLQRREVLCMSVYWLQVGVSAAHVWIHQITTNNIPWQLSESDRASSWVNGQTFYCGIIIGGL